MNVPARRASWPPPCLACRCRLLPAAQSGSLFRSGIELVNLGVAVMDRAGTAVDAPARSPTSRSTKAAASRTSATSPRGDESAGERPPLHIGLVFDTSGSMAADMDLARGAAIKFLNRLQRAEDITVVDFDTEVRIATYAQSDFTRLVARLRGRKPDGWTALFDAVGVYLGGSLEQAGQKVLIVFTDGGDTRSTLTYSDLLTTVKASDVSIYAIGFLEHQSQSTRTQQRLQLSQLADVTGGQAFFPGTITEVEKIYDRIVEEIDSRYLLGYVSSNTTADGRWRPVEVRLTRADLKQAKIRTRKGYYAPYQPKPGKPADGPSDGRP